MKVLFINKFLDKEAIYRVPLGIMSLSAIIKDRHETKIVDPEKQDVRKVIESFKPGIISYSLRTGYHQYYLALNKQLKREFDYISVFGGPHVTFYSDVIQEEGVDAIGFGEADDSFSEFVDAYANGQDYQNVKNFWFKTTDGIRKNPKKPLVRNLDDYPFPDRDLFDEHEDVNISRVQSFIASRGCPFECTYCFNAGMAKEYKGQKYTRRRSVTNVMEEVRLVKEKYNLEIAIFEDDTFNLSRSWVKEFCEEFAKLDLKLIPIGLRAELITEEQVRQLKSANCTGLVFGLESGDMEIRRKVLKRNITDEQMINASKWLRKHQIKFMTENLLGVPGTTLEDDFKTLELNLKCRPFIANAHILQPYPGTEIYTYAVQNGYFDENGFDKLAGLYKGSSLRINNKAERQRLNYLFGIVVMFPFLYPITRFLIKLPLDSIYILFSNVFKAYVGIRWTPYKRTLKEYRNLLKRYFAKSTGGLVENRFDTKQESNQRMKLELED